MSRELTAGSSWSLRRAAPDAGMEAERRTAATRRVTALAGVGVLVLTGAWLAFAAASNNWLIDTGSAPEPHWALGPLAGALPALTDASFSALLVAMLAGYLLTVVSASALDDRALIGAAVVLTVLFTLTSPLLSSDVFGYVDYARLGALHGVNPYLRPPSAVPHDAVYPLVYWQSRTTPYGPLFTLLTYPLAHLSVAASVWAVKALIGLGALAAIAFTVATARTLGIRPGPAAFLFGCNPLLLVYGVGGGHNDLLMAALCAAAVMALVQRRSAASGAAIVAA
ncbi:MAG: hypothetical protein M3022_18735, partial [Actinomycetota bacterium]|nr:hypothetical protein [Actinomycetota bacterium]